VIAEEAKTKLHANGFTHVVAQQQGTPFRGNEPAYFRRTGRLSQAYLARKQTDHEEVLYRFHAEMALGGERGFG
jgi:hypothetical protein